ncbi:MAG: GGDEF domain-containing protein [Proteobacteria bacterium]|nr:GGDEF domain-containing protein [Pseudomonadota bacterium]
MSGITIKRLLAGLATLALLVTAQGALVHVHANEREVADLRYAALPAGVDPAADAVRAGLFDAAFQPLSEDALRFAQGAARWYRLRLAADWRAHSAPLLVIHNARFQPVTLYLPRSGDAQVQHHAQAARDARFSRRALVFELPRDLRAGESLYLRMPASTKPRPFSARVYPEEAYHVDDTGWVRVMTFFESVQFTMILVGLTLWLALRDRLYGYFVGYLVPQFLYLLIASGDMYSLPGTGWLEPLGIRALWFVAALSTPFALSFIIEFCELRRIAPRLAHVLSWLRWPWALLALTSLLPLAWHAHNSLQPDVGNTLFLLCALAAIVAVIVAWRRGSVAAGVFLLAWIPQSIFTALRALQLLLQLPLPGWLEFGLPAALALSSLVLTLGLGLSTLQARRERDAARNEAQRDPLTGVHNRRALMARIAEALTEARQQHAPLSLIFLDLDHFKAINDRHGHLIGDACLRILAERVQSELRPGDTLARWGGEEFVVLLPATALGEATLIGERIRRRVEADPFIASGVAVAITVSLGLSGHTRATIESPEQLIEQADAALYRAKAAGRNRLIVHPAFAAVP